jgi:hypothetical protein
MKIDPTDEPYYCVPCGEEGLRASFQPEDPPSADAADLRCPICRSTQVEHLRGRFVRRAIRLAHEIGGAGRVVADYLLHHVEDFGNLTEVRDWLRNIGESIRQLRDELRAIES